MAALIDLVVEPTTGRLSISDIAIAVALVTSTAVMLITALDGRVDEWLFGGYLAAWVTQSQASKRAAIKRRQLCGCCERQDTPPDHHHHDKELR